MYQNPPDQSSTKELIQNQFGASASKYKTSKIHSNKEDLDFVSDLIQPKKYWKVLDIATGTGHLAIHISQFTSHVIATDITKEMLDQALEAIREGTITNIEIQEADVHDLPYESNSFDLVMSRIAPHHFFDINLAVSEMTRVCKSKGFVFIEDTIAPDDGDAAKLFNQIEKLRDPSHIRDLIMNEWIELLKVNDCIVIKQEKRIKNWPLRWWTDRMNTSEANINLIITLLEENYMNFRNSIGIIRTDKYDKAAENRIKIDQWTITPFNGYFLAKKN